MKIYASVKTNVGLVKKSTIAVAIRYCVRVSKLRLGLGNAYSSLVAVLRQGVHLYVWSDEDEPIHYKESILQNNSCIRRKVS